MEAMMRAAKVARNLMAIVARVGAEPTPA